MTPELSSLIERCKAATGPDRKIDYAVYLLTGHKITNEAQLSAQSRIGHLEAFAPAYTSDLNAIVALIESTWPDEGAVWTVMTDFGGLKRAHVALDLDQERPGPYVTVDGDTPCLALLGAFLTAYAT